MAAADRYAEQGREALVPIEDSEFKRALLWVPDSSSHVISRPHPTILGGSVA